MKTDNLITALAADLPTRPKTIPQAVGHALMLSVPIALGILIYAVRVRPDFWAVATDPRFVFKFVFTLTTLAAGVWLTMRLSRPGQSAGPARVALGLAAGLLLAAVVTELALVPADAWMGRLVGTMAVQCMMLIPLLAAAPLAALLLALRAGAPDSPRMAGAAAGLMAGAIGATLYASHCTNDSPLFVAVWYVIALSAVTFIGSLIGGRVLRW